jgi:hypothetical protein
VTYDDQLGFFMDRGASDAYSDDLKFVLQTLIQRQEPVTAKGDNDRFFLDRQHRRAGLFWSHWLIAHPPASSTS